MAVEISYWSLRIRGGPNLHEQSKTEVAGSSEGNWPFDWLAESEFHCVAELVVVCSRVSFRLDAMDFHPTTFLGGGD